MKVFKKLILSIALFSLIFSQAAFADSVNVPAQYGKVMTYQREYRKNNATNGWKKSTLQGQLRIDSIAQGRQAREDIFGLIDCATIDGRLEIATTPNIGGKLAVQVGDYVDVLFEDGSVWYCIIADMKDTNDPGCNSWGHDNGQSTVEIMYWTNHGNSGNQYNKISSISKVGNFWEVMDDGT